MPKIIITARITKTVDEPTRLRLREGRPEAFKRLEEQLSKQIIGQFVVLEVEDPK